MSILAFCNAVLLRGPGGGELSANSFKFAVVVEFYWEKFPPSICAQTRDRFLDLFLYNFPELFEGSKGFIFGSKEEDPAVSWIVIDKSEHVPGASHGRFGKRST
jgi:hypothetical protein